MALLNAGCSMCGRPYAAPGIKVLAQREEIAFVQLVCFTCQTQTLALVTGVTAASEDPLEEDGGVLGTFRPEAEAGPEDAEAQTLRSIPPISEADVQEMRAYLADYQGDLRSLLQKPGDDHGTAG
jgi:hypothetical protein